MTRAFTLVELLVVVAIIVILAAMLTPAMEDALAHARRAQCMSNQRQLGIASHAYATEFQDYHVPVDTVDGTAWLLNRSYVAMVGLRADSRWGGEWWPPGFLACPDAPSVRGPGKPNIWDVQGFNWAGLGSGLKQTLVVRRSTLANSASKAQMVDTNDWHTQGVGYNPKRADYEKLWDVYGDVAKTDVFAMVTYRHQQGAVVLHFDGHAGYYRKQDAWRTAGSAVTPGTAAALNARLWQIYE